MTNLTEQWKKGKLPEGFYFVDDGAEITIDYYLCDYWERHFDNDVNEVLAPVPSYEQWQRILHYASKYEHEYTSCAMDYENLKEENTKLKELLKECKALLSCLQIDDYDDNGLLVLSKINQVLGEE